MLPGDQELRDRAFLYHIEGRGPRGPPLVDWLQLLTWPRPAHPAALSRWLGILPPGVETGRLQVKQEDWLQQAQVAFLRTRFVPLQCLWRSLDGLETTSQGPFLGA